ncbi:DUF418 domain-containing protein [Pseudonocardia sp.]|uniref:DUF418 domain-containing protein n=1 Tax=Pseudonocardia sp. TaxID=60912 RepID=UPI003D0A86E4
MRERIASLDVLRGVAILGTFATNVWLFAHPGGPLGFIADGGTAAGGVEAALRAVSNGKFLALLTLLFGVGMELQYRSAERRGTPWPGRYLVRSAVLFVEGLLHYLLVFEFDVLMGYAITSMVVAYLIGRSDRVVRWWVGGVGAVYVALLALGTAALFALPDPGPSPVGPEATASWTGQVATRVAAFGLLRAEIVLIVPSAVVLFLAGSRLLRAGAFADTDAGWRLRQRLMLAGFGVGGPLTVLTALGGADWFLLDRYLVPPLVALGLLGLVTEVVLRVRAGAGQRALAAVGRTALSCYVLQNVVASVLCYGWGLGLAARFGGDPLFVVLLWTVVCAVCAGFAVLWLRRFDRGPLELVLHRLTGRAAVPVPVR